MLIQCETVGRPIRCAKNDKPTMDEVTAVQQQYIAELMQYVLSQSRLHFRNGRSLTRSDSIWDTYKDEFARSRKRELSIIE
jgi:hypothetical protein